MKLNQIQNIEEESMDTLPTWNEESANIAIENQQFIEAEEEAQLEAEAEEKLRFKAEAAAKQASKKQKQY